MNPTLKAMILGAGGHATSVAETVLAAGYLLEGFVDEATPGRLLLGREVLNRIPQEHLDAGGVVVLAVGANAAREAVWSRLKSRVPADQLPPVVHPSASVSRFAHVGPGAVVMQRSVVASQAVVGLGCLLNSGSILEHDSRMGDFSSLAPGAVVGGCVQIGARAALSIGAVVRHGIRIGSDTVIGAASYVHRDVDPNVVAYGTPARFVRKRLRDDRYL